MVQEVGSGKSKRGRPIELGGALVTLVEPHKGHEVAYNRWYERDHFYAGCMIGAWTISGARYVCTRDLKALRYPADSPVVPDNDTGSYLALYWVLNGRFGEWIELGHRPGEVADRRGPDVPAPRPHPHAHVQVPRPSSSRTTGCRSSWLSTTGRPTS